jgi:hypothetical protein
MTNESTIDTSTCSTSLTGHILRGVGGVAAFIAAGLTSHYGWPSLLLLGLALYLFRGCPSCWMVAFNATRAKRRALRAAAQEKPKAV